MGLQPGKSKHKKALRADSALFQTIKNRDGTTTGIHTTKAADAADPNVRAARLDAIAHDDMHAGISED